MRRYMCGEKWKRNIPAITEAEQQRLHEARVCVAGCGALGEYILEYLARVGVGHFTVIDGDRFEFSNLNRQLLSDHDTIGQLKVLIAEQHILRIAPEAEVQAEPVFLTAGNASQLLSGADLVMDALDTGESRVVLAEACRQLSLPLIHGAVQGWSAQVTVCMPGDKAMELFYLGKDTTQENSCLSFTPALCAAVQCAEAVKLLTGREPALKNRVLTADLRNMDFISFPFS